MSFSAKSILGHQPSMDTLSTQVAYALFRFYCGISIAIGAGLSKVFHKIDENGDSGWDNLSFGIPQWFVDQVGEIGFTFISPSFWAHLAVYGEFIGGLLIAIGLWTRVSALQLAFQFFVVSFIWYDEPKLFSMYYQQLIFWSFVMITAAGGGRFSLDAWWEHRRLQLAGKKQALVVMVLLLSAVSGFSQTNAGVSFTVNNPGLKTREIDIRYFDATQQKSRGYGYDLGALASHAVHMPAGARVYDLKQGKLLFVVDAADNGRTFNLDRSYDISEAQRLQATRDEQAEAACRQQKQVSETPETDSVPLVHFKVAGKFPWARQIHVRVQLPGDTNKSNVGFSRKLSRFEEFQVHYPVGAKLYLCDGPYWKRAVSETLILEITEAQQNYLVRL